MQDVRMAQRNTERSHAHVFANVHVIFCDVDGVFTDGKTWATAQGQWTRAFSVRDTMGLRALRKAGFRVCILTPVVGHETSEIRAHFERIGVDEIRENCLDPQATADSILRSYGLTAKSAAFIREASNGAVEVVVGGVSVYTAARSGGDGAVLEISTLILQHAALGASPAAMQQAAAREF